MSVVVRAWTVLTTTRVTAWMDLLEATVRQVSAGNRLYCKSKFFSLLRCNSSLFLQTLMTVLTTHVLMVRRAWMVTTTTRAVAFLGLLENDVELVRSSND